MNARGMADSELDRMRRVIEKMWGLATGTDLGSGEYYRGKDVIRDEVKDILESEGF